ncbi:hypothetical protein Tco_0243045, partial [Tanacetum coccineum]
REPLNITKVPVMKNVEPSRGAFKYAHKDNEGKNDGKSYVNVVKSNEKPGWAPSFNDEGDLDSDDESVNSQNACSLKEENFDKHSDIHISEAREAEKSEDPFLIYDLLNKKKPVKPSDASEGDLRYPPGFTPREGSQDNQFIDKKSESTTRCKEDVLRGSGWRSGQFKDFTRAPTISGGSYTPNYRQTLYQIGTNEWEY